MARLIIPEDFPSQKKLLEIIKAKDTEEGTDSVIKPYLTQKEISLTDDADIAITAQTSEDSRFLFSKQSPR